MVKSWTLRVAALLERRRWWVIGACIVAQWIFIAWEALLRIAHNGWIYQNGDDGSWYWTSAWTLSSLRVPVTVVGMGWPYVLTPLAAVFGPNMANGLPALIALNVVVLAPAAVVGMYLLGRQIAGCLFGVWSAVLLAILPAVALFLYNPHNRPTLVNSFLPTATGLNALADFPSMVCAIFGAYLLLRALETNNAHDGLLCGLVLGFLVLLKPSNAPLPLVACLVLAFTLRQRALVATVFAMAPALIALTLWKKTGLGQVPLFALGAVRESIGLHQPVVGSIRTYVNPNWHQLGHNIRALQEVFWSLRLLEFLLVAGALGLLARSRAKGVFVVGWFVTYALLKASVPYAGVEDTSVYRFLLPAWPAWVLIVSGVVFCWPWGAARRREWREAEAATPPARPTGRAAITVVAIALGAGPVAVAAIATPIADDSVAQSSDVLYTGVPIPVVDFALTAKRTGRHVIELRWNDQGSGRARTSYRIFRAKAGTGCKHIAGRAPVCYLDMRPIGFTRNANFQDSQARGLIAYRVGLGSGDSTNPRLLLLSKPATVTLR